MLVVAEKEIAGLMTAEAAFDAVEAVFAAMARREAYNFPVVREAIGHEDALYGFKGGFDASALTLGLKAGGYWPNNQQRGLINHQSTVFLFDPDTGRVAAAVGGNLLTALRTAAASAVSIKYLAPKGAKVLGMIGAGHQSAFQMRAAASTHQFERVIAPGFMFRQPKQAVADDHGDVGDPVEQETSRHSDDSDQHPGDGGADHARQIEHRGVESDAIDEVLAAHQLDDE